MLTINKKDGAFVDRGKRILVCTYYLGSYHCVISHKFGREESLYKRFPGSVEGKMIMRDFIRNNFSDENIRFKP